MRLFIESDFAGAGRAMRLRHAFLQTRRFVVGQTWSTFSDPEADPIGIDFEGLNAISRFRQPLFRWTPSPCWLALPMGSGGGEPGARPLRGSGRQLHPGLHRQGEVRTGPKTRTAALHGTPASRGAGQAIARRGVVPLRRRPGHRRHRRNRQWRPHPALGRRRPHQICRQRRLWHRPIHCRPELTRRPGCRVTIPSGRDCGRFRR